MKKMRPLTEEQKAEKRRQYQNVYYRQRWHEDPDHRQRRLAQMRAYVDRVRAKDPEAFKAKRRESKRKWRARRDGLSV
jgi:hypothetical protein